MRCKKHFTDISSGVGVCASCLREKLFALIAAQAQHTQQQQQFRAQEERRKSDINNNPPPLVFPRSVSPYISRRSSDTSPWHHHDRSQSGFSDQRFYFTPQIGPNRKIVEGNEYSKKKTYKFSMFYNLFRSKSEKPDSDPVVSNSGEPCMVTSSSSSSWFSSILSGRRKKQNRTFSVDESTVGGRRRACRNCDRGMSPARYSDDADGDEHCQGGSSGYSSESSPKQTPRRTPAVAPGRRSGGKSRIQRNVSGMTFCLSPLVRASPNRQWNQKSMPPDMILTGDIRVPVKSQSSTTSTSLFCKNGSRKLADFGRANGNHRFRNS
ncbi:uncharacterized protein LOC115996899 [Ipomoea triloba]|uniref:uncharacterized protein LOC115996899 n=1 Tax=Ipomoea triloba TaxID=35885 RepID=UPI00125D0166|nr:uncharacterized protein LOC115996899 [Ipomoea triloba]